MTGDPLNIMAGVLTPPLKESWSSDSVTRLKQIKDVHAEISEQLDKIDEELGVESSSSPADIYAARNTICWSP